MSSPESILIFVSWYINLTMQTMIYDYKPTHYLHFYNYMLFSIILVYVSTLRLSMSYQHFFAFSTWITFLQHGHYSVLCSPMMSASDIIRIRYYKFIRHRKHCAFVFPRWLDPACQQVIYGLALWKLYTPLTVHKLWCNLPARYIKGCIIVFTVVVRQPYHNINAL